MSDNVISLFSDGLGIDDSVTVSPPRAVETVVEELEQLLEAARRGDIVGIAGAYQYRSGVVGYSYAGAAQGYAMLGGLECVRLRLAHQAIDNGKM
jgi:hypothetical protein